MYSNIRFGAAGSRDMWSQQQPCSRHQDIKMVVRIWVRHGRHGVLWFETGRVGERAWMSQSRGRWLRLWLRGRRLRNRSPGELEKSLHDKNTGGLRLDGQDESLNQASGGARW